MDKVWFITGTSRGIGAEIAKAALEAGDKVAATGRNPDVIHQKLGKSENLFVTTLDVTNDLQVNAAVTATLARFKHIDVLVNNAGFGQLGAFEEASIEQIRTQFETNVFGLMKVTRAIIPSMRKQRAGRIFNISSIGGIKGTSGFSVYSSSKFAVEGFSQAIAEELAPFGIFVTAVSPGHFRTDFLDPSSVRFGDLSIPDYSEATHSFRSFHDSRNHKQAGDPMKLAKAILALAEIAKPPVSFVAGSDALMFVTRKVKHQEAQLKIWRELSVSTDGSW